MFLTVVCLGGLRTAVASRKAECLRQEQPSHLRRERKYFLELRRSIDGHTTWIWPNQVMLGTVLVELSTVFIPLSGSKANWNSSALREPQ
jgi:hypothetical protein